MGKERSGNVALFKKQDIRENAINVKLTDQEMEALREMSSYYKYNMSAFIRELMNKAYVSYCDDIKKGSRKLW